MLPKPFSSCLDHEWQQTIICFANIKRFCMTTITGMINLQCKSTKLSKDLGGKHDLQKFLSLMDAITGPCSDRRLWDFQLQGHGFDGQNHQRHQSASKQKRLSPILPFNNQDLINHQNLGGSHLKNNNNYVNYKILLPKNLQWVDILKLVFSLELTI